MTPHGTSDVHGTQCVQVHQHPTKVTMTIQGAHVAPVEFDLDGQVVTPYSLAPWLPEEAGDFDPVLKILRGDFLCVPFGEPEGGLVHGEVANSSWDIEDVSEDTIRASLRTKDTGATFHKEVRVAAGQPAVYQRFTSPDLTGRWNYGTHPVLDLSAQAGARISNSPLAFGSVNPTVFSDPARGETQILQVGAHFDTLQSVPLQDGGTIDLSTYPTNTAHEDLVALVNDPASGPLGWTAVAFSDYVWVALKDIRALPTTLLWLSNAGRTGAPWNGRHAGRLGVEDVCSYFALGHRASLDNPFLERGIPTYAEFDPETSLDIRTIQFVAATPEGFDVVRTIEPLPGGRVLITSESGHVVQARVDWEYVLD